MSWKTTKKKVSRPARDLLSIFISIRSILYFTTKSSLLFLDQQDSVFSVQMGFSSP